MIWSLLTLLGTFWIICDYVCLFRGCTWCTQTGFSTKTHTHHTSHAHYRYRNTRDTHNSNDAYEVRGVYDKMPSQEEILGLADGSSLPGAREKASQDEIMSDKYAIVDHISLEICCGQKHNFNEARHINRRFRQGWARVCAEVFRELSEVVNAIHHQQGLGAEFEKKLERRIKMFFLIPTLFFRKIKGKSNLNSKISLRLNQWHNLQQASGRSGKRHHPSTRSRQRNKPAPFKVSERIQREKRNRAHCRGANEQGI